MSPFLPLIKDRHVLVLGLGASGMAMARWCAMAGARVTVADTREQPPQAGALKTELPQVECCCAAFDEALFQHQSWAMVCKSPGIAPSQMAGLTSAAEAVGIPVVGELGLFASGLKTLAESGYTPKVLAITGTNGKTTTTSLTGHLLEHAGMSVAVAGNIGPTLLDVLRTRWETEQLPQAWVLELSSFQLDGVQGFEPTAATVLNVTQDHLDWHGTMQAYAAAKARIFGSSGLMVLNREDATVMAWHPQPVTVREGGRNKVIPARDSQTFGTQTPSKPGDWGIETVNGMAWLVRALPVDGAGQKHRGSTGDEEIYLQRLMPVEALRIKGRHNASNALAALALATAAGAPLAPMLHGLREYRGEPHRVESVAIVNDVEFIDDSKGTNVGATLAAINGLGTDRGLVVILGGEGKGQDFSPLAPAVAAHVRAVALIGRDAPAIRSALQGTEVVMHDAADLPEAVRWSASQAQAGDAVLLSPACASLDMFKDYAHRAQVFIEAVQAWAQDQGGVA